MLSVGWRPVLDQTIIGPAVPVHLLDPDRPVLDRRCQRNTHVKKQNPMNVVFLYREHFSCVSVALVGTKNGSNKKKWFTKKSWNPKLEKWKQWRQWGKSRASPWNDAILRFDDLPCNDSKKWTIKSVWQWGKSRASPVKRPILRFVDRPLNDQFCNLPIYCEMTPSCNLTISRAMTPPCNLTISRDVAILWFDDLSWNDAILWFHDLPWNETMLWFDDLPCNDTTL